MAQRPPPLLLELINTNHDSTVGLVLVGEPKAGKTCLAHLYCSGAALTQTPRATEGTEILSKSKRIGQIGTHIRIVDCSGAKRFREIVSGYLKQADGVVFVYDAEQDPTASGCIASWLEFVYATQHPNRRVPLQIAMIANKCDLVYGHDVSLVTRFEFGKQMAEADTLSANIRAYHYKVSCNTTEGGAIQALDEFVAACIAERAKRTRNVALPQQPPMRIPKAKVVARQLSERNAGRYGTDPSTDPVNVFRDDDDDYYEDESANTAHRESATDDEDGITPASDQSSAGDIIMDRVACTCTCI